MIVMIIISAATLLVFVGAGIWKDKLIHSR